MPTADLPETFFVDSAALSGVLDLQPPPTPFVASGIYARSLQSFTVTLSDDEQFERPGDTHFAFVVPERAFEDTETIRQAIEFELIRGRLAACLLMVDFPNPIFSAKRLQLLRYVPDTPIRANPPDFFRPGRRRHPGHPGGCTRRDGRARVRAAMGGWRGVREHVQRPAPELLHGVHVEATDPAGLR